MLFSVVFFFRKEIVIVKPPWTLKDAIYLIEKCVIEVSVSMCVPYSLAVTLPSLSSPPPPPPPPHFRAKLLYRVNVYLHYIPSVLAASPPDQISGKALCTQLATARAPPPLALSICLAATSPEPALSEISLPFQCASSAC